MVEVKAELFAAQIYDWHVSPIVKNRHKWWLQWYRAGDNGDFCFTFISPQKRRYAYYTERGRVTCAYVMSAKGVMIARYYAAWRDSPYKLDAVMRLTPRHILDKLYMLLDAIR